MLLGLLLTLNILVCLALIGVVLLQRSEGGALGTGGSPTGLITTRGAGDLLTRTTWVLFVLFLTLSLALTLLGGRARSDQATLNGLKGLTVNPDALRKATQAPRVTPPPAGQAVPPPVQLPPLSGAGALGATPRPPAARHIAAARPNRAVPTPAPTPSAPGLTLPPLTATPPPLALSPVTAPAGSATPPS